MAKDSVTNWYERENTGPSSPQNSEADGWEEAGPAKDQKLLPPVRDRTVLDYSDPGDLPYALRYGDLQFLGFTERQVEDCYMRNSPLCTTPEQWGAMRDGLDTELAQAEIDPADFRIQGSGGWVYSSEKKAFPRMGPDGTVNDRTREDIRKLWPKYNEGAKPSDADVEKVAEKLSEWRSGMTDHPNLMPFDAAYKLGFTSEQSDLDIQASSDEMVERCRQTLEREQSLAGRPLLNEDYGFVDRAVFAATFPGIVKWAETNAGVIERKITISLFPESGPENTEASDSRGVSSHHRYGDFRIGSADEKSDN